MEVNDEPGSPSQGSSPRTGARRGATHTSIIHLQTNVHPGAGGPVDRLQGGRRQPRCQPGCQGAIVVVEAITSHLLPAGIEGILSEVVTCTEAEQGHSSAPQPGLACICRPAGSLPSNRLPPEGRWHGLPSGIKSALQKAVRRGNGPAAVHIALEVCGPLWARGNHC
jgi:hypothetical protein